MKVEKIQQTFFTQANSGKTEIPGTEQFLDIDGKKRIVSALMSKYERNNFDPKTRYKNIMKQDGDVSNSKVKESSPSEEKQLNTSLPTIDNNHVLDNNHVSESTDHKEDDKVHARQWGQFPSTCSRRLERRRAFSFDSCQENHDGKQYYDNSCMKDACDIKNKKPQLQRAASFNRIKPISLKSLKEIPVKLQQVSPVCSKAFSFFNTTFEKKIDNVDACDTEVTTAENFPQQVHLSTETSGLPVTSSNRKECVNECLSFQNKEKNYLSRYQVLNEIELDKHDKIEREMQHVAMPTSQLQKTSLNLNNYTDEINNENSDKPLHEINNAMQRDLTSSRKEKESIGFDQISSEKDILVNVGEKSRQNGAIDEKDSYDKFVKDIKIELSEEDLSVMLGISSAKECRRRRVSAEFHHKQTFHETIENNILYMGGMSNRRRKSCNDADTSTNQSCRAMKKSSSASSLGRIAEEEGIDTKEKCSSSFSSSSLVALIKKWNNRDQDQRPTFPPQCKNKIMVNEGEIPYGNTSSLASSPFSQGDSSLEAIHISEQDLGSDAESLPSCGDSYTASESPPNSPELSFQVKSVSECNRRVSAPEVLNRKALVGVIREDEYNLRRRNSSVEEAANKVRFQLEESFKKEECRYKKQFEDEHNAENKYEDVEQYKTTEKSSPLHQRKVSCPPNLNTHEERRRKISVFSDASEKSHEGDMVQDLDDRKLSLHDQSVASNRKMSYQELKKSSHNNKKSNQDRKLSLQDNKTQTRKTSLQEKTSLQVNQMNLRKASLQERKLSQQMQDRKYSTERKLSSHDRKLSTGDRKNSSSERKISLTETFRAVVGTRKKSEQRKNSVPENPNISPDENNNTDKKSTWGIIKNKIKKDRKGSTEFGGSPNHSPRTSFILSRNNSTSSIESGSVKKRSDSLTRKEMFQRRTRSIDYDRRSSYIGPDSEDAIQEVGKIVPKRSFDIWSDGKVDIDLDHTRTLPLIHVAAGEGNIELLKTLIDVGVDINELDHAGWPALHYAICAGHFECAQLLMTKGSSLQGYSNRVMNSYCSIVRESIRKSDVC